MDTGKTSDQPSSSRPPRLSGYSLLRMIGKGGFGEVWYAETATGGICAVKVVRRERFDTHEHFVREFEGIRQYDKISRQHEALINILHVEKHEEEGYYCYVMELADDLGSRRHIVAETYEPRTLKSGVALPVNECLDIGLTISDALDYMHRSSFVHRDVKPSNVLYVNGKPKLSDMGLMDPIGKGGAVGWSKGYVPRDCPGTVMADIYALGKVLYEINTGNDRLRFPELPAGFETDPEIRQRMLLNRVITTACDTNPANRYRTAKHLHVSLARVRDKISSKGRGKWTQASTLVALGVSFVLAACLVVFRRQQSTWARSYVEPAVVETRTECLEVKSRLGNVLWEYVVDGEVSKAEVVDLDADGKREIVVAVKGKGNDAGKIIFFDPAGTIRWEFCPAVQSHYPGGSSGRMTAESFELLKLRGHRGRCILAYYRDLQGWYQSCLILLDSRGAELGRYWHPGHLGPFAVWNERNGQNDRVIVAGLNNDLQAKYEGSGYVSCVFAVDLKSLDGEAPPYLGGEKKGSQDWYGVILPRGDRVSRLDIVDHDGDGSEEICIWTSMKHIFYVSFDGALLAKTHSDTANDYGEFNLVP